MAKWHGIIRKDGQVVFKSLPSESKKETIKECIWFLEEYDNYNYKEIEMIIKGSK